MILRILSRAGTLDKLKGRVVTGEDGRVFLWGGRKSACTIQLDSSNPAPEKPIPGGIQLDVAHIRVESRHRVHAELQDATNDENDLFLAVNLYLPPDFTDELPVEVVRLNDGSLLRNRFFCDSSGLIKLGLSRTPTLSIHAFVLIRKGEVARLIHRSKANGKTGCWYIIYNSEAPKVVYHKDYSAPPPCLA